MTSPRRSPSARLSQSSNSLSEPHNTAFTAAHSEDAPLLDEGYNEPRTPPTDANPKDWTKKQILYFACVLMIVLDFGAFLSQAPGTKIFEDAVCEQYYLGRGGAGEVSGDLEEDRCKIEPVQSELAFVRGWEDTFDVIPGIVSALLWGVFADRFGRRPVLLLSMTGCTLADMWVKLVCWWSPILPIRWVWASSIWLFIGGGPQVASSIFFVIVSDISSEEQRAASFFRFSAAVILAEVVAMPVSAALMTRDPWIPYILSTLVSIFGIALATILPETIARSKTTPACGNQDETSECEDRQESGLFPRSHYSSIVSLINTFRGNLNVVLMLTVFFVGTLGKQALELTLLYASKKFGWTIARASFLISLRGSVHLLLLVAILPLLSHLLTRNQNLNTAAKDLRLSQLSALFLTVGSSIMFAAATPAVLITGVCVFALGSGLHLTARSLVTSLVLPEHVATLYTAVAMVTSVGMLVAGPLLAATFRWGMLLGDEWLGLPFLAAAGLYLCSFVAVSSVDLRRRGRLLFVGDEV